MKYATHHYFALRLFASPANSSLTSVGRKRRAIQQDEVVRTVVKSATSPISDGTHFSVFLVGAVQYCLQSSTGD
jgi:hypothetical protein